MSDSCVRCKSIRLTRFLDGYGETRLFCKKCGLSFPVDMSVDGNEVLRPKYFHSFTALRRIDTQ